MKKLEISFDEETVSEIQAKEIMNSLINIMLLIDGVNIEVIDDESKRN